MNPAQSDNSAFWGHIQSYAAGEGFLVVIDPRKTEAAKIADLWLPVRPGTDAVLALGLLNAIISEGLCDESFVETWCHGFDELARSVAPWTPEASRVCGVDADDIRRAARLFGSARAPRWCPAAASTSSGAPCPTSIGPSAACALSPATWMPRAAAFWRRRRTS